MEELVVAFQLKIMRSKKVLKMKLVDESFTIKSIKCFYKIARINSYFFADFKKFVVEQSLF